MWVKSSQRCRPRYGRQSLHAADASRPGHIIILETTVRWVSCVERRCGARQKTRLRSRPLNSTDESTRLALSLSIVAQGQRVAARGMVSGTLYIAFPNDGMAPLELCVCCANPGPPSREGRVFYIGKNQNEQPQIFSVLLSGFNASNFCARADVGNPPEAAPRFPPATAAPFITRCFPICRRSTCC